MGETLRVGLVGVGWGALVHAPALRAVAGYELVALCATRPESAARASERLGVDDTSTDWESFVRRDDLDLISISAPVPFHREMTLAALDAGKHVLCEKPLAMSADECLDMVRAAERGDRATAVCFENRWSPERLAIRTLVEGGALGRVSFVQATVTSGYWHPTHPPQAPWMYRRDQGGGYLFGQMSHEIDFVLSLFGPATAVCADVRHSLDRVATPDGDIEVTADDTSALLVRLASGALAVFSNSTAGLGAGTHLWEAHGSSGTIATLLAPGASSSLVATVDGEPHALEPSDRQLASGVELPARRSSAAIKAMGLMLEDWLPAFGGAASPVPTLGDGRRVQQIIDAALRSSAGGGWVDIEPTQ